MKEIAKNVYHLPVMPRNSINCYLIDNILVDAGIRSSGQQLLKHLKGHEVKVHALTHAHADHQGSSKVICDTIGIPLWTSEKEKANAESGNSTSEYPSQKHLVTLFQKHNWAGPGHPVSKILKEGDTVGSFTVIDTPGHSSGHISFFRESDGVLIVGDVLINMNFVTTVPGLHLPPDIFTSNVKRNIESVKKIASLKPKVLCFGHGPVLVNHKGDLERFIDKLQL